MSRSTRYTKALMRSVLVFVMQVFASDFRFLQISSHHTGTLPNIKHIPCEWLRNIIRKTSFKLQNIHEMWKAAQII